LLQDKYLLTNILLIDFELMLIFQAIGLPDSAVVILQCIFFQLVCCLLLYYLRSQVKVH